MMAKFEKKEDLIGQIQEGRVSRRDLGRMAAGLGITAALLPMAGRGAQAAGGDAVYFTWSGYDIPEMYQAYIDQYGEPPKTPVFADMEEALQKIRAGFRVDITHPCISQMIRWRQSGEFQPIDVSRLSNWPDVFPDLANLEAGMQDGEHYFVPCDWGNTSVIYRTDLVDIDEESYGLLWDERYKGRLSIGNEIADTSTITLVYVGAEDPFNPTDADLVKVREAWQRQRPLLRMYWSDTTEIEQALATGELVASTSWNSSVNALASQGVPVKFMNPKEGIINWCCGLVMDKRAEHVDAAYELLDALISPETGQFLLTEYGYGHANKKAFDLVDDEVLVRVGIPRDPSTLFANGWFSQGAPRIAELQQIFEEVKAGL
ncbi:MAG: extracellular solute-binding protein [Pseudomonadota bacterium]